MCGICGVFYFEGSTGQVDEPVLRRMTATMVHRGPDGEGLWLPELLLMRVDKTTMSTSVEARVPFLDRALVEFSMGIPMAVKIRAAVTKHILKKACQGLIPDRIIHRRQGGFAAPLTEWLRGDFGAEVEETIVASRLRAEGYLDYAELASLFARHRGELTPAFTSGRSYNLTAWVRHMDRRAPSGLTPGRAARRWWILPEALSGAAGPRRPAAGRSGSVGRSRQRVAARRR